MAEPKFAETWCSQCGAGFGPGDHGYSHCKDHRRDFLVGPGNQRRVAASDPYNPEDATEIERQLADALYVAAEALGVGLTSFTLCSPVVAEQIKDALAAAGRNGPWRHA